MLRLHPYIYHRPADLDAALELLDRHAGDVLPIAGGTDLVPNMKHKLFTPGHLVALSGLDELKGAGLLSSQIPSNFKVPVPPANDELADDEDPITQQDLEELGLLTPLGEEEEK